MKMILTAALLALGVGLFAVSGASAANLATGVSTAAANSSIVEKTFCRTVRTCHRGPYGHRRCVVRRYCR